jgi:hypothetical protein
MMGKSIGEKPSTGKGSSGDGGSKKFSEKRGGYPASRPASPVKPPPNTSGPGGSGNKKSS